MVELALRHGGAPRASVRPVRLSRRGRFVLIMLLFVVAAVVAGFSAAPGQAAPASGHGPTVVVGRDDTLWSIAHRHAPERDPFETIDEIRQLNGIGDYTVHPGQRLALPRRR